MGEFGVSEKHKKGCSFSNKSGELDGNNKLEAFSNKMMLHQNHHHRPFSSHNDVDGHTNGPTMSFTNHHHKTNALASSSSSAIDGAAPSAAPATPLQPFLFPPPNCSSTFKSSSGGIMGFPFTSAQWKELERQAMIYKYMMNSVPVPPDLLIIPSSLRSPLDGGFNLRLSSGTDPEPGRCRRTDGKKWRCSRDVAPNHKYCERHMHRGRPRSRKPVEVHTTNNNDQQIKRPRLDSNASSDVTLSDRNGGSSSSNFLASATTTSTTSQPYLQSSLSLHNFGLKGGTFDSSHKEPRGLDWMLNGDPISLGASDSQWQSLMHNNKVGNSCNNTDTHYLNSYALYSYGLDQQNRSLPLFLNPLVSPMETLQSEKPRGFIDAWSNAEAAGETNSNTHNKNSTSASISKLSLSSLDLSMGSGYVHEEMGLGLMDQHHTHNDNTKTSLSNWLSPTSWVASNPLAEVLRSSTVTSSNPSSPAITNVESNNSPLGTMVSSPSGVLQKTLASFSDSSSNSNSSPTVASSRANNSEIALLRSQPNVK